MKISNLTRPVLMATGLLAEGVLNSVVLLAGIPGHPETQESSETAPEAPVSPVALANAPIVPETESKALTEAPVGGVSGNLEDMPYNQLLDLARSEGHQFGKLPKKLALLELLKGG